jgi:hypothetical protein
LKGRHYLLRRDISTFQYSPLNSSPSAGTHIRLLKLYHGKDIQKVEASLEEVLLSEELRYEAVSYCWGDPQDVRMITCNGQQLRVPAELEVALRNMRYSDRPRMLWADAICINQSDLAETESQVQLMRRIF